MSTSRTSAASIFPGHPRRPSRPVRSEEAIPLSQSALARTVAPSRSACRHTSTARAPRTTSTGSHTTRAVRTARSTSRLPSYSTSALGMPYRRPPPAARTTAATFTGTTLSALVDRYLGGLDRRPHLGSRCQTQLGEGGGGDVGDQRHLAVQVAADGPPVRG